MNYYFSRTDVVAAAICFLTLLGTIFFYKKSRSHKKNKTIASSSSLTLLAPSSSLPHNWKHHVFPSFHGADVRTNFLSHIVKEFSSKGINLFIDNDIERSKSLGPELIEAIKGSRIVIVLLSKNYASSTWCLNELVEIMNCREEFGQTVMSVFYQVEPTHVKKQTGDFGKVFRKTCKGKTKEEIQRWKHALIELAQIAGYHSKNWKNEAEMIEDIATDVSNKLNLSAPSSDFDGLVGMASHMIDLEPILQLDSDEVRKVGIWGPPGIGKTTIARSLFNRHSKDFQLSVFMDNIKRKYATTACSDDYSVKLDLQKHFMSQLTNVADIKNFSHLGIAKDRLKDKRVLVIVDDVDRPVQVEAVAKENSWFGPGSRIIITSQDQNVLKASEINHIHRVNLPSYNEALEMFCMYAFGQKDPKDGFGDLPYKIVSLIGKLPLGLKVMGSYFRGMSEQDCREVLPRLEAHLDRDGEIASILKFSYDSLCDEDKRLFLHIAIFFNGEKYDIVEGCLEKCFSDVRHGLRVLTEKSLISKFLGEIEIDKLLVELARKIVREQSVNEPGKRQFLTDAIGVGEVLSDDRADSSSVVGFTVGAFDEITWTSERAFERLSNLQFLRILGKGINPLSMNHISQKLRVLIWEEFKMTCFPSSFNPKFLVKLKMPYSKLEKLWEETKPLNNLKWMDLSYSYCLEELPELSTATNLYDLDVSHCSSLVKLPYSIGNAISLGKLNVSHCSNLVELPSSIGHLTNLQELNLSYCSRLVELPSSIGNVINLQELNLSFCSSLLELPFSIGNATNLQKLNLSHCSSIVELPSSADIEEFDPCMGRLSRLRQLVLNGMKKLVSLPQLPGSLCKLDAEICQSLERLDCSFRNLDIRLNFRNCFKLNQEARDLIIQTPTNEYAVLPAEEVPQYFTHRSSGSSLTVKLNQMPLGTSTKYKACIVSPGDVDEKDLRCWRRAYLVCRSKSGGKDLNTCFKIAERVFPGHLYAFEVEVETEKMTSTELVFEFEIQFDYSFVERSEDWEIKECGMVQLLEVSSFHADKTLLRELQRLPSNQSKS